MKNRFFERQLVIVYWKAENGKMRITRSPTVHFALLDFFESSFFIPTWDNFYACCETEGW